MRRYLFITLLLAIILTACGGGNSTTDSAESSLAPGEFWMRINGDDLDGTYHGVAAVTVDANGDTRVVMTVPDTGSPAATFTLIIPPDARADTYQMCPITLYELDQCKEVGFGYAQVVNGAMTDPLEYARGEIELTSVNPPMGTFSFAATFEESGALVEGGFHAGEP